MDNESVLINSHTFTVSRAKWNGDSPVDREYLSMVRDYVKHRNIKDTKLNSIIGFNGELIETVQESKKNQMFESDFAKKIADMLYYMARVCEKKALEKTKELVVAKDVPFDMSMLDPYNETTQSDQKFVKRKLWWLVESVLAHCGTKIQCAFSFWRDDSTRVLTEEEDSELVGQCMQVISLLVLIARLLGIDLKAEAKERLEENEKKHKIKAIENK